MASPQQSHPKWIGKSSSAQSPIRLLIAVLVGSLLAVVGAAAPASSHLYSYGMPWADFQVKPYSYNDWWQEPMDQAISNWNNTPTPVWITKSSSALSWVEAGQNDAEWYGHYRRAWNGAWYFHIQLNARTISRDASNFRIFVISVFAHELGHALKLAHNTEWSIMWSGRNRNYLAVPTRHDIDDVNAFY